MIFRKGWIGKSNLLRINPKLYMEKIRLTLILDMDKFPIERLDDYNDGGNLCICEDVDGDYKIVGEITELENYEIMK